ncbi:CdaR family protein [Mucilaginibacter sp.]|uniref:CdaR family protein n=1 Tax=Mucilaginibacter sp. TaxID=1882438 RepID=UPI003D13D4BC
MAIIKLSATERRRLSAFFTCLVLAVGAWVFTVLSNSYNYTVKEVLNFRNTPQKRAFHSLQSDTVNATVSGNGWQMLFSKVNRDVNVVSVDLRSLEYKSYVVLSSQLEQINTKKEIGQQITAFNPDTLYFDFSNRKVKRIPIQLNTDIRYKQQFAQANNIMLNPAYVIVNGPASVIDSIKSWPSDTLKLDSVGEPVSTRLNLQAVKEGNLSVFPKNVQVSIPVDEFTEKVLEIPVKLINNHNYDDVKIFPQKVKVTFTISLSRYAQTDEDFFEATADLDLWRKKGYKVLPVIISKQPAYSKIVKIEPQNIDFIVKK